MDLETWVSIAVLLGTGATICTLMLRAIGKLDRKIDTVRDELGGRIEASREELRSEFKTDIGNLITIVLRLDERVYDLATGSRQHPLIVPPR